ncbi:LysR family transcriptional regulator [Mucilaginibacter calamicampi]|uniref:LysR family transcriptional regulator n=1 Tax=Mucilaginibacter calamicampi TaxID=1302352 RepID=A0ABW2YXS8_9SPHI
MNIQQLGNFLIICELLNYRKAAEQINIVQPALSKQIQLLEQEVGAVLFDRSRRTVSLTPAGLFFKKETDRILHDLKRTIVRTAQIHNGEVAEVRVTHSSSAMNTVVPSFLASVKKTWPMIKTTTQETSNFQQLEMLLTRKTDLGVAPNIILPEEVNSKILYREDFVLILPANHRLANNSFNDLTALKDEVFILPQVATGIGYVEEIFQMCQDAGFTPKIAHESANVTGVLRMAEAGLGISIEPISGVKGVNMDIALIPLKNIRQKVTMTLFWLKEREEELGQFIQRF